MTSLIELYTSEGCSSCPPAETWLSRLKDSPGLWREFVPLAFHVDYWNQLGWRDPWSSPQYSKRQQVYAQAWNSDTVYTPEVVFNGREWRTWKGNSIPQPIATPGVLAVTSTNAMRWRVTFVPNIPGGGYEAHAAQLVCDLNSNVRAGENRGLQLQHDFVVVALSEKPMFNNGGVQKTELECRPDSGPDKGRQAIAVWITRIGQLAPLQATGGWLPSNKSK